MHLLMYIIIIIIIIITVMIIIFTSIILNLEFSQLLAFRVTAQNRINIISNEFASLQNPEVRK
jgi:hypothetical protein